VRGPAVASAFGPARLRWTRLTRVIVIRSRSRCLRCRSRRSQAGGNTLNWRKLISPAIQERPGRDKDGRIGLRIVAALLCGLVIKHLRRPSARLRPWDVRSAYVRGRYRAIPRLTALIRGSQLVIRAVPPRFIRSRWVPVLGAKARSWPTIVTMRPN